MGKVSPDAMLDASLDYVAGSNRMIICSAEPSSYADATAGVDLVTITVAAGDFTKANDTSGRKVTIGAKTGTTIDHSGTATHVALVLTSDTTLRYVTTCDSQALTAAGTVDTTAWKINLADPT